MPGATTYRRCRSPASRAAAIAHPRAPAVSRRKCRRSIATSSLLGQRLGQDLSFVAEGRPFAGEPAALADAVGDHAAEVLVVGEADRQHVALADANARLVALTDL